MKKFSSLLFLYNLFFLLLCGCKDQQQYDFQQTWENLQIGIWQEDYFVNENWNGIYILVDLFRRGNKIYTYEFKVEDDWGFPIVEGWRRKTLDVAFDGHKIYLQQEMLCVILDLESKTMSIKRDYTSYNPISTLCFSPSGKYAIETYGYSGLSNIDYVLTDLELKTNLYLNSSIFEFSHFDFIFLSDDCIIAYNQHACWLLQEENKWIWNSIEDIGNFKWTITDIKVREDKFYLSVFEDIDSEEMNTWPYPKPKPAYIRVYNDEGKIEEIVETDVQVTKISKSEYKEEICFIDDHPVLKTKKEYQNLESNSIPSLQSEKYDYILCYNDFIVGIWGKSLIRQEQFAGLHLYFDFYPNNQSVAKRYNYQLKIGTADDLISNWNKETLDVSFDGKTIFIQGNKNSLLLNLEEEKFTVESIE